MKRILYFFSVLLYRIMHGVMHLLPAKNIIFESIPNFADNTYFLYKKLLEMGYNQKYEFYWFVRDTKNCPPPEELPAHVHLLMRDEEMHQTNIHAYIKLMRAKFIIDCNDYVYKLDSRTKRIHLKHGLPIKDASDYTHQIGEVDMISVPSTYWVPVSAKEHGVPETIVQPLGFPRNAVLVPKPHPQKTIIWMPTYRVHKNDTQGFDDEEKRAVAASMPFGLPCIPDAETLRQVNALFAKYDAQLLIRLHPVQDISGIRLEEMSHMQLCDDAYLRAQGRTLYEQLCLTDALISDYSSIYFDYLNLDKPIALVIADFETYKANNGVLAASVAEFKAQHPANHVESLPELLTFMETVLRGGDGLMELSAAKEKYMGAQTVDCAEKIIQYMQTQFDL